MRIVKLRCNSLLRISSRVGGAAVSGTKEERPKRNTGENRTQLQDIRPARAVQCVLESACSENKLKICAATKKSGCLDAAHFTATVTPLWLLTALLPVPIVITIGMGPEGVVEGIWTVT